MFTRSKKRALPLMAAAAIGLGGVVVGAAPAQAEVTAGNVWVNFGKSNCPGGKIVSINWAVDNFSSGPSAGDIGDNVIYPKVRIGTSNVLSYQLWCKFGRVLYQGPAGQKTLTPARSGQSFTF